MLMVQKRRSRSNRQRTKYSVDKCHYNALTQKFERLLSNYRNESYTNHITTLTEKHGSLYKKHQTNTSHTTLAYYLT